MEQFSGKIWVLGDDIDTDIIIPTEYLALKSVQDMKPYAFSPLRPELASKIAPGDIIVAGKNFGCGSSREQAPEIIKALGVRCVIAKSFARIFFRNSINNGLLLIENDGLQEAVCRLRHPHCTSCPPTFQGRMDKRRVPILYGQSRLPSGIRGSWKRHRFRLLQMRRQGRRENNRRPLPRLV